MNSTAIQCHLKLLALALSTLFMVSLATASPKPSALPFGGHGLIDYWPFDTLAANPVIDPVEADHHGSLKGLLAPTRIPGPLGGGSLAFLVPGRAISGPDTGFPAAASPGSISLWFNRPPGVNDKVLFSYGSPDRGAVRGLWIAKENDLCFYFWGHPGDLHTRIEGGIAADQWHHVAATYDGAVARLYYDGALIGERAVHLATQLGGSYFIGSNLNPDGRDYLGLMDEVVVLRRQLTEDEIRDYYRQQSLALQKQTRKERRAFHVHRERFRAAQQAEVRKRLGDLECESIVFAVRQVDTDGHWYANFGYDVLHPEERKYYHQGGRLCHLNLATGKVTELLADSQGGVRDPQVHYSGRKVLFSYRQGGQPYYHLYEINLDHEFTSQGNRPALRQLTDGPYDDIEPAYLPDGGIVFCSSRCHRWVPCYFTQVAVLYRCDGDGQNIRQLSANVEHENTPWILPNGKILYQRWEYVDRSQVGYHHLWTMNPDGTGQMVFYGNQHPDTVMIDAKPIPGSPAIVASFSPGHGRNEHAGIVTIVDPRQGPDARERARPISPGTLFRDPYPLSPKDFLVAKDTEILLLNDRGHTGSLFSLPAAWRQGRMQVHEPRPLRPRPREHVIPSQVKQSRQTGQVILEAVYRGRNMAGVQPGEIKQLLVLEVLPKPYNMFSGMEPLSYGGTFLLQRILGTVPVEPDGSAYFELPALRPLFFVALDEKGMAVKRMQSFLTVQPGETVSCVGCHESRVEAPRSTNPPLALRQAPRRITPIAHIPGILDFPRDIQPILDRHCVSCHDYERTTAGGPMAGGVILTGDHGPMFSHSYYTLTITGQISDGRNLRRSNYPPRGLGSSASPLMDKLEGRHYGVVLDELERQKIRLWIDSSATYPGTYAAMGTGSVGSFVNRSMSREDLRWSSVRQAQKIVHRRCASCHQGHRTLPDSPTDIRGRIPWSEQDMKGLGPGKQDPRFRYSRHLVYNLTRPGQSLLLLAPLAREAGGFGLCAGKLQGSEAAIAVFESRNDPDYVNLLQSIRVTAEHLQQIKRFDMQGFQPRPEYVREMQRYGLLPGTFDPQRDSLDVYAMDRRYWESLWFKPKSRSTN